MTHDFIGELHKKENLSELYTCFCTELQVFFFYFFSHFLVKLLIKSNELGLLEVFFTKKGNKCPT
jgi:hypothetical protein